MISLHSSGRLVSRILAPPDRDRQFPVGAVDVVEPFNHLEWGVRQSVTAAAALSVRVEVGDEQFVVVLKGAVVVVTDQVQEVELVDHNLEGGMGAVPHGHHVNRRHVVEEQLHLPAKLINRPDILAFEDCCHVQGVKNIVREVVTESRFSRVRVKK